MKKIFGSAAILATALFVGCTTEGLTNDQSLVGGDDITTNTLTIGLPLTKTQLGALVGDRRKIEWSEGDQIKAGEATSSDIEISENRGLASFKFTNAILDYPCNVLYPAEMWKNAEQIALPATQAAATGSFGADSAPMAAVANGEDAVSLKHLTAVVHLLVKASGEEHLNLQKVIFKGKNNEQVSGDFNIDYDEATLEGVSEAKSDKEVTVNVAQTLSAEEAIDVYIVVPARNYDNGFTVTLVDDKGHYMEKSKASGVTLAKGDIYNLPEFAFEPTGTTTDIEISNAEEWVEFANNFNEGVYDSWENLSVNVTDNIDFTGVTVPSIGCKYDGGNRYFNGTFNGNDKSIKNWVSTTPLFAYTATSSTVRGLIIDASCTLTPATDGEPQYGAIVGWHKGTLKDCTNNANLTASGTCTADFNLGGIVGYAVEGTIENCTMTGAITVAKDFSVEKELSVGGVVGVISRAEAFVKKSTMTGTMTFAGGAKTNSDDVCARVGQIVGNLYRGECSDCQTTESAVFSASNYENKDMNGGSHFNNLYFGGIAGTSGETSTISGCTNNAPMTTTWYYTNDGTYHYSRYHYLAGIVAHAKGAIAGCENKGEILSRSFCRTQAIAGIVALAEGTASINECTNNGRVRMNKATLDSANSQARYGKVGGVVAECRTKQLETLKNMAYTECSYLDDNGNVTLDLGGVIAYLNCDDDSVIGEGIENNLLNSGEVRYSWDSKNDYKYLSVGGVIGTLAKKVTIKNARNEGKVSLTTQTGGNLARTTYAGGIVGVVSSNGAVIDNCVNDNMVSNMSRHNKIINEDNLTPCATGQSFHAGGIVGFMMGDSATPSTISKCHNNYDAAIPSGDATAGVYVNRGYAGGVVGYAKYTTISGCSSKATMFGVNTSIRLGGIAGYLYGSHITDCSVETSKLLEKKQTLIGGLAGIVNATSTVKNSTFKGNITTNATAASDHFTSGCVASETKAGAVIEKCGVYGTIVKTIGTTTTLTKENFESYLIGDSNIQPTGCYYIGE